MSKQVEKIKELIAKREQARLGDQLLNLFYLFAHN